MTTIDRTRLEQRIETELMLYRSRTPVSYALYERAQANLLGGVPMNWMKVWSGGYPIFVKEARGARIVDVDGNEYVDFCLGDTGGMAGHATPATVDAVHRQMQNGATHMLPTEDALHVGRELENRFGLPYWQFALTATDANRFALRWAREITGRKKILAYNRCYHGSVAETLAELTDDGRVVARSGNIGPAFDPALTTKIIEWNDVEALERALAPEDVACVLAEPAMTNIGIVQPAPGYHDALRDVTARTGTLLIIDETHTFCCGPGGYTAENGLTPDMLVMGKPIAGGIPAAVFGFSAETARRLKERVDIETTDMEGTGGTLAGNALSMAAIRATLASVFTRADFDRMIPLATHFRIGAEATIRAHRLPWHMEQLGCRTEYWFIQNPPRNGAQAAAADDPRLSRYMHLACMNRGVLMTPFHNMALMCPETATADVDTHTRVFREIVAAIV